MFVHFCALKAAVAGNKIPAKHAFTLRYASHKVNRKTWTDLYIQNNIVTHAFLAQPLESIQFNYIQLISIQFNFNIDYNKFQMHVQKGSNFSWSWRFLRLWRFEI